eukprot:scaffold41585_cov54-Cyclotella_meneghiniana.AAC.1
MHSMFVNLNDFCYALTVVAINIERGVRMKTSVLLLFHFASFRTGRFTSYCIVRDRRNANQAYRQSSHSIVGIADEACYLIIRRILFRYCQLGLPLLVASIVVMSIRLIRSGISAGSAASWARALHYRFMRCVDVSLMCI